MSFAPLAARLAARAAEIRPVDGAEVSWANFMALFVCAILEMLILLCEALDARAAAEAARLGVAPASRDVAEVAIPALRAGRQAPSSERRSPRLTLVPEAQAITPSRADAPSRTIEPPAPGSCGRATLARSGLSLPLPGDRAEKRDLLRLPSRTPKSLLQRNKYLSSEADANPRKH